MTVVGFVASSWRPPPSVTIKVTLYVPATAYEWDGFCALEDAPSPKVQLRLTTPPSSVEPSANEHARLTQATEKSATGGWLTGGGGGSAVHVYPAAQLTAASFAWPWTDGWK